MDVCSLQERQVEWTALEAWAKSGKASSDDFGARAIGISHFCRRQLDDILEVAHVPVAVNQAPAYACSVTCDVPLESQVELRREGQVQYHVGMGSAGRMALASEGRQKGVLYQSFSPLWALRSLDSEADSFPFQELLTGALVTGIGKKYKKTGPQALAQWLRGCVCLADWLIGCIALAGSTGTDVLQDMTLLTKAQHPAVGGGPSASDSGDCGIEEVGWTDATMGRARASDLMHGIDPMP
ncbi:Putative Aado-keto reductase [Durusdinium trenchii]|uniref:Aado-keto reductase n=1 Tax=Durusdinium trenchii TaxID=1381693 RepID=A0ABP0LF90_9DINO